MKVRLVRHNKCRLYREWKEYLSLDSESAVLDLTKYRDLDHYIKNGLNATARYTYRQSIKAQFNSHEITWAGRNNFLDDIHELNTSTAERQGKPMGESYLAYPLPQSDNDTCEVHYCKCIATFTREGKLVAYITAHYCGELAASSQIMGHANFLKSGIMINCWVQFVKMAMERNIKAIAYSRWTDGLPGLAYWKHSVGMRPEVVHECS